MCARCDSYNLVTAYVYNYYKQLLPAHCHWHCTLDTHRTLDTKTHRRKRIRVRVWLPPALTAASRCPLRAARSSRHGELGAPRRTWPRCCTARALALPLPWLPRTPTRGRVRRQDAPPAQRCVAPPPLCDPTPYWVHSFWAAAGRLVRLTYRGLHNTICSDESAKLVVDGRRRGVANVCSRELSLRDRVYDFHSRVSSSHRVRSLHRARAPSSVGESSCLCAAHALQVSQRVNTSCCARLVPRRSTASSRRLAPLQRASVSGVAFM